MNNDNNSSIDSSVYYARSSWNELIKNIIEPFFDLYKDHIYTPCVYLSTNQGEHISLEFETTDSTINIQKKLFNNLSNFVKTSPSYDKEIQYPLKSLFKDYPNNSNLIRDTKVRTVFINEDFSKELRFQISQAIIEGLAQEVIDSESIYTFKLYLQLGIIKAACPTINDSTVLKVKSLQNFMNSKEALDELGALKSEGEDDGFSKLFELNRGVLVEIIQEVWGKDHYECEMQWFKDWIKFCEKSVEKIDFQKLYLIVSTAICEQLNLKFIRSEKITLNFLLNVIISF